MEDGWYIMSATVMVMAGSFNPGAMFGSLLRVSIIVQKKFEHFLGIVILRFQITVNFHWLRNLFALHA